MPCSSVIPDPDSSAILYAVIVSVTPGMVASCFRIVSMRTIDCAVYDLLSSASPQSTITSIVGLALLRHSACHVLAVACG